MNTLVGVMVLAIVLVPMYSILLKLIKETLITLSSALIGIAVLYLILTLMS